MWVALGVCLISVSGGSGEVQAREGEGRVIQVWPMPERPTAMSWDADGVALSLKAAELGDAAVMEVFRTVEAVGAGAEVARFLRENHGRIVGVLPDDNARYVFAALSVLWGAYGYHQRSTMLQVMRWGIAEQLVYRIRDGRLGSSARAPG